MLSDFYFRNLFAGQHFFVRIYFLDDKRQLLFRKFQNRHHDKQLVQVECVIPYIIAVHMHQ